MNKCEWKDGKFVGCINTYRRIDFLHGDLCINIVNMGYYVVDFCPFCGADIRKPEETPLIVKSGGTLVVERNGVNYLSMCPDSYGDYNDSDILASIDSFPEIWKSFTRPNPGITELTDEIALLRPMVKATVGESQFVYTLWGIKGDYGIFEHDDSISWINIKNSRLATAHELQGAE